jgi:hypothetical protein
MILKPKNNIYSHFLLTKILLYIGPMYGITDILTYEKKEKVRLGY